MHEGVGRSPGLLRGADSAGGGNTQTTVFPDMRREIGCLKLDVVVILEFFPAAFSHPATACSENSSLPDPGLWDVSGQDGALRGQAPLSPSASRHLFLLDFEGGQVPSCPAAWEGGSVWCELTSCWGSWSLTASWALLSRPSFCLRSSLLEDRHH